MSAERTSHAVGRLGRAARLCRLLVATCFLVLVDAPANAADPLLELLVPLQTWGGLAADVGDQPEGLFLQASLTSGLDVGVSDTIYLSGFVGSVIKESTVNEHRWNNAFELRAGAGLRLPIPGFSSLVPGAWSSLLLGARFEQLWYTAAGGASWNRVVWGGDLQFGLDWARLRDVETGLPRRPLAMPLYVWFEVGRATGGLEEGVLLQGLVEQSFDITEVIGARIGPSLGLALKSSDRSEEFWNNHVDIRIGVRLRRDSNPVDRLYGSVFADARLEGRIYTSGDRPDEFRAVIYVGWWFGGALAVVR